MSRELKLRNKETGEIRKADAREDGIYLYDEMLTKQWWRYDLALLAKSWEFYKEPKTFWAISWAGEPEEYDGMKTPKELKDMAKQIDNYFNTREEAEEAVEKLKAWERLKDKGFEFVWVDKKVGFIKFDFFNREGKITKEMWQDIDLLFGGEK